MNKMNLPKFCKYCGSKLNITRQQSCFSEETGEPVFNQIAQCPKWEPQHKIEMKSESLEYYNPHTKKIATVAYLAEVTK